MTPESPAPTAIQFDTAVPASAPEAVQAPGILACAACSSAVLTEYFDVGGQSVCGHCRDQIVHLGESPKDVGSLGRAILFGLGAALLGALLYYAVIAITNFEIGIVAIAIGYMVGYAIRTATGNRGGRRFQVLAVLLTYWAVGLAYLPMVIASANDGTEATASASPGDPASASATVESAPAASSEADAPSTSPLAIVFLIGFSLALPAMVIFGSLPGGLLSAAIIGFGMHQAWRMTGAHAVTVTGPYRVGPPALPAV